MIVTWENLTLAEARGWIINYTVHYWDVGKEDRSTAHSNSTTTSNNFSLVIEGLDPFTTYKIVVTASTIIGVGMDSNILVLEAQTRPIQGTYVLYFVSCDCCGYCVNVTSYLLHGLLFIGALIGSTVSVLLLIIIITVVVIILLFIRFR